jgi:hypothetical protein
MFFGVKAKSRWLVEANVSEKHAVSIFKAEVISQDSEGPYIYRVARREV